MNKFKFLYRKLKNPENVWYGGGLKRETALRSVGNGWSKLINNLYDAKPKQVKVTQVKEKFGTLRFYVGSAPAWYFDLINYYEYLSAYTCEACGEKGSLRDDLPWILTLCDKHYEEEIKHREVKK